MKKAAAAKKKSKKISKISYLHTFEGNPPDLVKAELGFCFGKDDFFSCFLKKEIKPISNFKR